MDDLRPATRPDAAFPVRHDRPRHRRDGDRATTSGCPTGRRAAIREAVARGVKVSIATGRMPSSAVVYANQLGLTDPIVGHQGAVVRAMAAAPRAHRPRTRRRSGRRSAASSTTRRWRRTSRARRSRWCLAHGLDPHVNDLERIIVWRGDARFEDYSGVPRARGGDRRRTSPRRSASRCRKVIAVGDPPRPMELIEEARRAFAGRAGATVSHPRFLEFVGPGVSKGRRGGLAGAPRRHPDGPGAHGGRCAQRRRDDRRCRARGGDGVGAGGGPGGGAATSRRRSRRTGSGGLIEALVLAPPDEAARNGERLAAEADALPRRPRRRLRDDDPGPPRRRRGARRGGRAAARRAGSSRSPPTRSTGSPRTSRCRTPSSACSPPSSARPRRPSRCCSPTRTRPGRWASRRRPRGPSRTRFWPGGLTLVLPVRPGARLPRVLAAGTPTDRRPRAGPPRAAGARARRSGPLPTTSANLSGRARCARCRGGRRHASGDAVALVHRRRPDPRRPCVDGRRLHVGPAADPARRARSRRRAIAGTLGGGRDHARDRRVGPIPASAGWPSRPARKPAPVGQWRRPDPRVPSP